MMLAKDCLYHNKPLFLCGDIGIELKYNNTTFQVLVLFQSKNIFLQLLLLNLKYSLSFV